MPPQRACERTPHSDGRSLGAVSDARSLQAPREGPLEGCRRSHHWQLHVRPPQKESQTLRREAPPSWHSLAHSSLASRGPAAPTGVRGSQASLTLHGGPCTCHCERLHQNLRTSKQALAARRHLLTARGTSWLQADTLCCTQLCSWQTAGPCQRRAGHVSRQRLSGSNRSLGASVPHSGNSHTASNFFLVIVPMIRDCDGAPVTVLCTANEVHVTRGPLPTAPPTGSRPQPISASLASLFPGTGTH